MSTGWTLLGREEEQAKVTAEKKKITSQDIANRASTLSPFPLPWARESMSVALTLGANEAPNRNTLVRFVPALIGPALVAVTIFLSYRLPSGWRAFWGKQP